MKLRKAALPAGGLTVLILLTAWVLNHLSGHGGGSASSGSTDTSVIPAPPAKPGQTLQVVIQDDRYLVDGKEMTAAQIIAAAGGTSEPAVKIVSEPNSRLGAQRDLQNALDAAHLSWALDTEPADGR